MPFFTKKVYYTLWAVTALVMLFGVMKYPAAPIRKDGTGYFDKQNRSYTEAEYKQFKLWEATLIVVWGLGFASAAGMYFINKRIQGAKHQA